ncbi:hypothetical protein QYE76_064271 [Lolium multiflorum]|uniref:Uncharacterized protein n=1 Tax=Lolium multiflorum TaxID=4521 RepID=A0AAD8S7W3_LOLMU|nr:hypothetical protein QYE76_064271 [Lolium multiflorum]
MAESTPVKYEDLTDELKKKHDEIKAVLEAELIGSFHRTRSHGISINMVELGYRPEMPGLDRSIIEHRLPFKKDFAVPTTSTSMKAEILEEVKKEIEKMRSPGSSEPCRYAEWISSIVL